MTRAGRGRMAIIAAVLPLGTGLAVRLALSAGPTIHHVDNACANHGDGTTAACASAPGDHGAWNHFDNSTPDCAGVHAGDHIWLHRGLGAYRVTNADGTSGRLGNWNMPVACSGTAADRVIVENAPGEDVDVEGTADVHRSTWTAQGGGVYKCTDGTCGSGGANRAVWQAWYQRGGAAAEERLVLLQSKSGPRYVCDTSVPAGFLTIDAAGSQLCVHLSDGSSPAKAAYLYVPVVFAFVNTNGLTAVSHVQFRRNPAGGSFTPHRFTNKVFAFGDGNVDIVIGGLEPGEGLDLGEVFDRCVELAGSVAQVKGNRLLGSTVHDCGQEGVHLNNDTSPDADVEGNTFRNIQRPPEYEACKPKCLSTFTDNGTAVRVGAGTRNTRVRWNHFAAIGGAYTNAGSDGRGINLEESGPGHLIEHNTFDDLHAPGQTGVAAIMFTNNAGVTMDRTGTVVQHNTIIGADYCYRFAGAGTNVGTVKIQHDRCRETVRNGVSDVDNSGGTWAGSIDFSEDEFVNAGAAPSEGALIRLGAANNGGIHLRVAESSNAGHNRFWCPRCGRTIVAWKGVEYTAVTIASALDPTSVYAEPVSGGPASTILAAQSAWHLRGTYGGPHDRSRITTSYGASAGGSHAGRGRRRASGNAAASAAWTRARPPPKSASGSRPVRPRKTASAQRSGRGVRQTRRPPERSTRRASRRQRAGSGTNSSALRMTAASKLRSANGR